MLRLFDKKDFHDANEIEALKKTAEFYITQAAIDRDLGFRATRKLALISGAGIAGLAASIELLARGFKVVIAEKRKTFDRFNVINLDVESQRFLKRFGLLNEFENTVAGRIGAHNYVQIKEDGIENLQSSDVSKLEHGSLPFEPEFINEFFKEDGVYSVRIKDLQAFLAKKALEGGAHIFGNVDIEFLARTQAGGVSNAQLIGKHIFADSLKLKPHFLFVAEGAHSTTAQKLGMNSNEVKNECTGENWIFGNVEYHGKETFVVSVIDTSGESLEIANIIFNAKIREINIALTSKRFLSQELIQERLLAMLRQVFTHLGIDELPQSLTAVVNQPVHIKNEKRAMYSIGNAFCIGDTAGHSSPLAGMGGTLGLTLVPSTIGQLVIDSDYQPLSMHHNFHRFTEAYTSKWIAKSQSVKQRCLKFFSDKGQASNNQEQTSSEASEVTMKSGVSK